MGWNTSALFARGEDILRLLPVRTAPTGATVPMVEATSGGRSDDVVFVNRDEEWQQVWDPSIMHVADAAPGQNTLSVFFSSVSSSYGFILVEGGELVRQAIYVDGELAVQHGEPLPIESQIPVPSWGPDESWVWAIIMHLTAPTTYDEEKPFDVYAVNP